MAALDANTRQKFVRVYKAILTSWDRRRRSLKVARGSFLASHQVNGVKLLADVREASISRKHGFSRDRAIL